MEYFSDTDPVKDITNQVEHGVSFRDAREAFLDPDRVILDDPSHSTADEIRYKCVGKVHGRICTVRFTYRDNQIRIFGAGYWRKERKIYEQQFENR